MAISLEQAYGATAADKKKKGETNFFVSAAAGVASGLIKIPEGVFSLGAELIDLGLGTETAESVENFFDDLNPFDEVAESRGIGKITQALASIGPVAVKGATLGVKAASSLRAANLAKRALEAKRIGNTASLSKLGRIIHKGQDVLTTPLAGGIIGSGVGESLVSDEDIGTLGDMLKGTSLEPYAITMMDTESKEGRAEAFRRLTNRIKFGTEGALFNLGITGAAKGVKKLREPATYGLERWAEGGVMETVEKALYGLKPAFAGTQEGFEAQRASADAITAAKAEAATEVARLHKAIKNVVPKLDESVDIADLKIREEIQDILQPFPGKKVDTMKFEDLPKMIEQQSGVKNIARDKAKWKYEYSGLKLNKEGRKLMKDASSVRVPLDAPPFTEKTFLKALQSGEFPNVNIKKYTTSVAGEEQTRRLITPEREFFIKDAKGNIIGKEAQTGFFSPDDYVFVKGGKADLFLNKMEKARKGSRKEFESIIKNMRSTVDNLTGKISQKNLTVDLSRKLHSELGNYLTADYEQFIRETIPFFRVNRNTAKIKTTALNSYVKQQENAYRIAEATKTGKNKVDIVIPEKGPNSMESWSRDGTAKIENLLKAKSIDEIDPLTTDVMKETVGEAPNQVVKQSEKNAISVQTGPLKRKKLDEWQEIVLGRIKDPFHTFTSSVSKMASLNYTVDYVNEIARQGSRSGKRIVTQGGVTRFLNSAGEPINIKELTEDNIKKGRVKQKFYDENGRFYTPEETLNIATKETEALLTQELDRSKYIFGKGDFKNEITSASEDLVASGKAKSKAEADIMLRDPKQFRQVQSTGVDGLSSLDGKWMRAPIYETVFDTTNQWLNNNKLGILYKYAVLGPKTVSQISKTVLNALTHVRNFISAGAFVAANGAIIPTGGDFRALLPTSLGGDILETAKLKEGIIETSRRMSAYKLNPTGVNSNKAVADIVSRSTRVGVGGGTQAEVGEIIRMTGDFGGNPLNNLAATEAKAYRKLMKAKSLAKRGYEFSQKLYVEEDTFHKNVNWFLERGRYEKIFKDLNINEGNFKKALQGEGVTKDVQNFLNDSVERFYDKATKTFDGDYQLFLDEVGGKLTRNNVPNYAYVGRFGRALRMSPFGNFIAFPLEIMRSGSNIVDTSIIEMSSKIPAIQALGQKRLASFAMTVGGIPQVAKQVGMAWNDVSNEEMEALKRIVPEWSKNSTLVPMGRDKNGYLKYVDFSYSNAYDFLLRPIAAVHNAISEGKNDSISLKAAMGDGLQDGMRELLEPFAKESILSAAVIDSVIRGGVGRNGRRVWSEEDEPFTKMIKAVGHIGKQVVPMQSTFKQIERLSQAATGKTGKYGEEFKLKDELPGLWGFRAVQSNPERSLQFKLGSFGSSLKKAENLFTSPLLKGGRVTPEDILEGYQYSESRRFQILKQMTKDVEAMRELGMSDSKIRKELEKRKGLGKNIVNSLLAGVYTPKRPGEFFIKRMNEINNDLNQKEGVNIPNPLYKAMNSINQIISKNNNINLLDDDISFSQLAAEGMAKGGRVGMQEGGEAGDEELAASVWVTEPEPVKQSFEYDFNRYYRSGIWMEKVKAPEAPKQPLPPTPPVNANAIKDMRVNANVMQTGLTPTEQALLSPEEQVMRLKQRGIARA